MTRGKGGWLGKGGDSDGLNTDIPQKPGARGPRQVIARKTEPKGSASPHDVSDPLPQPLWDHRSTGRL